MSWKNILKEEMSEEERKEYMKKLAEQSEAFERFKEGLKGSDRFKPGETFEQHRKRLGY